MCGAIKTFAKIDQLLNVLVGPGQVLRSVWSASHLIVEVRIWDE